MVLGDPFSDVATVKPIEPVIEDPVELNTEFKEFPWDFMDESSWSLRFSQHVQYPKHITALEGKGAVAALRHTFRSLDQFGWNHLHLVDNLGLCLALAPRRPCAAVLVEGLHACCWQQIASVAAGFPVN